MVATGARSRPLVMVELNIYSPVTSIAFHSWKGSVFNKKKTKKQNPNRGSGNACAPTSEWTVVFKAAFAETVSLVGG